jgi:CubicO group peptidase (beta-lactamase class C family)
MIEGMVPKYRGSHYYHGHTRGLILGELLYRVDPHHREVEQFIKEEFTDPLDVQYYVGNMPEKEYKNVLNSVFGSIPKMITKTLIQMVLPESLGGFPPAMIKTFKQLSDSTSDVYKVFNGHDFGSGTDVWTRGRHTSVLTISNAHSLAKIASLVGNGSSEGFKVFDDETLEIAHSEENERVDLFTNLKFKFTKAGFCHWKHSFGWDGTGGSAFRWNRKFNVGFAFVPTGIQFGMISRFNPLEECIIKCCESLQ